MTHTLRVAGQLLGLAVASYLGGAVCSVTLMHAALRIKYRGRGLVPEPRRARRAATL